MMRSVALILVLMLAGCSYNAATGRHEMIFISSAAEADMGKRLHVELSRKNRIITNTPESRRIESIGQRLARISDRQDLQYRFFLIDSKEVNAFTTPGGYIYFYTGLYEKLKSDDAIAAVLAHEIGHVAAKHTVKKFQAATEYNIISNILLNVVAAKAPGAERLVALGADGIASLAMSAYSRQDEFEADRLGIKYLQLAGFDVNAIIDVFVVLKALDKGQGPPLFLRSHPYAKDRIEAGKKEIERVKSAY